MAKIARVGTVLEEGRQRLVEQLDQERAAIDERAMSELGAIERRSGRGVIEREKRMSAMILNLRTTLGGDL